MSKSSYYALVIIIFLVSSVARIFYAINAPLIGDEKEFLAVANSISFDAANLNLPVEHPLVHHPLLSVYALKAGVSMFGQTKLGIRFFSLLSGLLTLLLLYGFTRKTLGSAYAIVSVVLLGLNKFHIGISGLGTDDSLLLFFSALSIFLFWKALITRHIFYITCAGVSAGLAYLTKESAILLLGCYLVYLIITPKFRNRLRQSNFYALFFSFLCTIFVDILWVLMHGASQRLAEDNLFSDLGIGPSGLGFFLIEIVRYINDVDYYSLVSWEYPTMSWIMGLVLIGCCAATYFKFKEDIVRFMCVILFVFVFSTSFFRQAEFYWAQISLIPAVYLSAIYIERMLKKTAWMRRLIFIFLFFFLFTSFNHTFGAKYAFPPDRFAGMVDYDTDLMQWLYLNGQVKEAIKEAEEALKICPNEVRIHNLLGIFYVREGRLEEAGEEFKKATEIKDDFSSAKLNIKLLESGYASQDLWRFSR